MLWEMSDWLLESNELYWCTTVAVIIYFPLLLYYLIYVSIGIVS